MMEPGLARPAAGSVFQGVPSPAMPQGRRERRRLDEMSTKTSVYVGATGMVIAEG
jgi:hypothetical protein